MAYRDPIQRDREHYVRGEYPDLTDWRNLWAAGIEYERNDMVRDGSWLMVANKQTQDRAAPQPEGDPYWSLPTVPTWETVNASISTLFLGARVGPLAQARYFVGARVWVPALGQGLLYRLEVVVDPLGVKRRSVIKRLWVPDAAGAWVDIEDVALELVKAGQTFDILLSVFNLSSTTDVVANYNYRTPAGEGSVPTSGQMVQPSLSPWVFRVNKTDDDAVDQSAMLLGLGPGDQIIGPGVTWVISSAPVDGSFYVEYLPFSYALNESTLERYFFRVFSISATPNTL